MKNGKKVIIGVIGSDCHAVGNKIINHVLETNGFEVVNIGVLSPQMDFINAAIETEADAIIVSSLYGHGELDCQDMRKKCEEVGLKDILLYVGGNIVVGKQDWSSVEKRFKDMGFDRVYKPGTPIEFTTEDLKRDLGLLKTI
ncbi:MAG: methylaspartate mutase subunit S [Cetobacterium sp.]|uniref:methylaspartate mutase subunit S n=1 Tax=Cetobacterium sp. TaxID=2071632 RepID=UPI003F305BFA